MRTLQAALLLFATIAAAAQNVPSERVELTLVEVPVNVTTSAGEPIRGLTKENFALYDNGQPREISHFEVIDFAARAEQPKVQQMLASGAARRNFMLLFDLGNSDPISVKRARDAALQFIDKQLLPGDRLAVASISPMRGFELHATFSTDRALAREAVRTLGNSQLRRASDPLRITLASVGRGQIDGLEGTDAQREASSSAEDPFERMRIIRQIRQLTAMGKVLDRVAGRKEVILLSEGFDASVLSGVHQNSKQQLEYMSSTERGEIWNESVRNMDLRYGNLGAQMSRQRMIDALRRSDVVLNAIDIKGLRGFDISATGSPIPLMSNESLHLLTRETGGLVLQNDNNLKSSFARMLKAQEVTYVLAFERSGNGGDKFHKLKVKVLNVPGARVHHRVGYSEAVPDTTNVERLLSAGEIMLNSISVNDVRVAATAIPFRSADALADVPVIVQVDGKSLLGDGRSSILETEFFIYAFDAKEVVQDYTYQKVSLDVGKTRDKLTARGMKFLSSLTLPSGEYTIRTLVRQGSRHGFVSVPLHVPTAGDSATRLALNDPADWLLVMGNARGEAKPYPLEFDEKFIIPAAMPVLASGSSEIAVMPGSHASGQLNVTASVKDATGTEQNAPLSLISRTESGAKLLYSVQRPALAPGAYSLVFVVHDEIAGDEQSARLPFTVE